MSLLAEALAGIRCWSAVIDAELVFPTADGRPDFYRLQSAMASDRQHELAVFAFDLLHYGGEDLRSVPLIDRRLQLTELVARSSVPCLYLVWGFDDGAKLLEAAERHGLEGIVSKRQGWSTARDQAAIGSRSKRRLGERRTGSGGDCSSDRCESRWSSG